jgi:hypothetical protein
MPRGTYGIVKRFHDQLPDEMRPSIGVSNAEELIFDKIDSGYWVTVATTEGAGRSATAQMLHASETAFWPDLSDPMGERDADRARHGRHRGHHRDHGERL